MKLEKLINLVNLLPPSVKLPDLSTGSNERSFYDKKSWTSKARDALYKQLKNQPENFRHYVWGNSAPNPLDIVRDIGGNGNDMLCEPSKHLPKLWQPTLEAVERYENFNRLRVKFHRLTNFAKSLETQKPKFDGFIPANVLGDVRLLIDQNGIVQYQVDGFSEAISGVDIRRIRECEICGCFFWAKNNNSLACSPKHSKARQMRLIRERWKENGHSGKGGYKKQKQSEKGN